MQNNRQMGNRSLSWATLILAFITLGGFGLRFYAIGVQTVWLDEAFSIWLAEQPLVDMWAWLIKIDQHPPLYYSLLHFWVLLFGDAQGAARALSAVCSGLAIPIFYAASRYLLKQPAALLATLLLALSPFQVQYAQEVRMYALLTLVVAVAFYLLMVVLFDEWARHRQWPWVGLAMAQAATMLTHNTATVFFPLALNAAIGGALLWKQWQGQVSSLPILNAVDFERRWLRAQLLAVALWLPWSIPFVIQSVMVDRAFWIGPPDMAMVYEALHNFNLAFLWPSWAPPFVAVNVVWWLLAVLGVRTLRQTPARAGLLVALFLLPIVGELLVSLRRPIFSDRTLIWVTLPYLLLVASGMMRAVEALGQRIARWRVGVGIGGLALLLAVHGLALHTYFTYFEKEDWAEAAAYVADEIQPGEMILFNATWVQLPFDYYFRHYEQDTPLRGLPVDLFDRGVLEPKMTEADLPYMRNLLADQQSVWLVYSHDWYTDPKGIIPREVEQQMRLVERRAFVGLQVMRFERTP